MPDADLFGISVAQCVECGDSGLIYPAGSTPSTTGVFVCFGGCTPHRDRVADLLGRVTGRLRASRGLDRQESLMPGPRGYDLLAVPLRRIGDLQIRAGA